APVERVGWREWRGLRSPRLWRSICKSHCQSCKDAARIQPCPMRPGRVEPQDLALTSNLSPLTSNWPAIKGFAADVTSASGFQFPIGDPVRDSAWAGLELGLQDSTQPYVRPVDATADYVPPSRHESPSKVVRNGRIKLLRRSIE